ncbi:hypothetical protein M8J76_014534 [Diaphorina citri]|nr:hypothetical protein M8J75_014237 [Diaphorina citri]KAI5724036.1 hypothetical protein M8J76_014534 [Diaphorina citri]KAI5727670.1 hypothetical protein M8J77_005466 [Diaphorina citri]
MVVLGKLFNSYDELSNFVQSYEKEHYVQLSVESSRTIENQITEKSKKLKSAKKDLIYTRISYKCVHGGTFKSKGKGKRKTPSLVQNCPFSMKVTMTKNGQNLEVTQYTNSHNHEVSKTRFDELAKQRKMETKDQESAKEMLALRCNKKLLKQHLCEETGKKVTLKDIHNLQSTKQNNLEETVKYLQSRNGGYVEVVALDGKLEGIFFQDKIMRDAFLQNPEVVLMDATYCLNSLGMPLYILMVVNANGQGQVAAVFLLAHETSALIGKMLSIFKEKNPDSSRIETMFTDKDFSERAAIIHIFPSVNLLFCFFHTLRAFKRRISKEDMNLSKDDRTSALAIIERLAYSQNEADYEKNYEELLKTEFKELICYYNTFWHSKRYEWVRGFMKSMKTYNITTTNHLESLNQKIKQVVIRNSSLLPFFEDLLKCFMSIHLEQKSKAINMMMKKLQTYAKGSDEEFFSSYLTPYAWRLVEKENKRSKEMLFCVRPGATMDSCDCSFKTNTTLPCSHMFYKRREMGLPIADVNIIPQRYTKETHYRNYCEISTTHQAENMEGVETLETVEPTASTAVTNLESVVHQRPLGKHEKFRKAMDLCKDICNIMSNQGTIDFNDTFNELMLFRSNILHNNNSIPMSLTDHEEEHLGLEQSPPGLEPSPKQGSIMLKDISIEGMKLKRKGRPKGTDTTVIGLKRKKTQGSCPRT